MKSLKWENVSSLTETTTTFYEMTDEQTSAAPSEIPKAAEVMIIIIYSTVLVGGAVGIVLMSSCLMKRRSNTMTSVAIINLVVIHTVFVLTLPFRIAYFTTRQWNFKFVFCKIVSSIIHIHMYLTFLFYMAILGTRYVCFFMNRNEIIFTNKYWAVISSATVWIVTIVGILPPYFLKYGQTANNTYNETQCFNFQKEFENVGVTTLNYIVITLVIILVAALLACQAIMAAKVLKKIRGSWQGQQDVGAVLKNLPFLLILLICYFPYHIFRIYYIKNSPSSNNSTELVMHNEAFLAATGFSCFDLLVILLIKLR
ncbi:probable G-protein coupled receptor 141 [Protopterus annectens]|uniref:probable G-protein coupled receptor 141 n=1 Tax=Protopterus annectens TaxID=7888 RepID=UPI001CF97B7F|nr:probable G-protein coupled receptor 141 [Protopterus annectens]